MSASNYDDKSDFCIHIKCKCLFQITFVKIKCQNMSMFHLSFSVIDFLCKMKQHTNSDPYLSKIYKSKNTARTVPKQLTHVCVKAMLRDHQRQYGDHPTTVSVTWQCVYSCLSTVLFYQTQGQGAWVRVSRWGATSHQSHLWSCVENLGEGDQVDGQGKCTPSSYICTTNLMCSFLNVITQTCPPC